MIPIRIALMAVKFVAILTYERVGKNGGTFKPINWSFDGSGR